MSKEIIMEKQIIKRKYCRNMNRNINGLNQKKISLDKKVLIMISTNLIVISKRNFYKY